jgi:hypothetical protein
LAIRIVFWQCRIDKEFAGGASMFRLGKPQELGRLPSILAPGETLDQEICFVKASSGFSYGILVLTNQRMIYFSDGAFRQVLTSYPWGDIVSFSAATIPFSFGYKKIFLVTRTESVKYKNIPKHSGEQFIRRVQQIIQQCHKS